MSGPLQTPESASLIRGLLLSPVAPPPARRQVHHRRRVGSRAPSTPTVRAGSPLHLRLGSTTCPDPTDPMATTRTTRKRTLTNGYGQDHKAERQRIQERLDHGALIQCACTRRDCPHHDGHCPVIVQADQPWDLGHTDDRTGWTGLECIPCNRSAGGRNSRASQTDPMTTRAWCTPRTPTP